MTQPLELQLHFCAYPRRRAISLARCGSDREIAGQLLSRSASLASERSITCQPVGPRQQGALPAKSRQTLPQILVEQAESIVRFHMVRQDRLQPGPDLLVAVAQC